MRISRGPRHCHLDLRASLPLRVDHQAPADKMDTLFKTHQAYPREDRVRASSKAIDRAATGPREYPLPCAETSAVTSCVRASSRHHCSAVDDPTITTARLVPE